jgi:hypothetical protein
VYIRHSLFEYAAHLELNILDDLTLGVWPMPSSRLWTLSCLLFTYVRC